MAVSPAVLAVISGDVDALDILLSSGAHRVNEYMSYILYILA